MVEIEITGIRKDNGNHDNPHEAVSHYRWVQHSSGKTVISSRPTVVSWLDGGLDGEAIRAYVHRVEPKAYCYVNESAHGTRFLETYPDASEENNLLKLPEC